LKLTIVLITHEMDVVRRVCDRVAVLDAGEIVERGSVIDVFLHPQHATTKRFVQEADSFSAEDARIEMGGGAKRTIRRLTFLEDTVHQPLLSRAARENGIDFSILSGRFGQIKSTACGQVTVSIDGEPAQVRAALDQLAAAGVAVEEVV
jgi:D-methionine transport system ATP-binding protein